MELRGTAVELVRGLYEPGDPIRTFLNAYVLCQSRVDDVIGSLKPEEGDLEYGAKAGEFRELLGNDAPVSQFRDALEARSEPEALLRAVALLTALAGHIAVRHGTRLSSYTEPYRSSSAFGGQPFWLAVRRRGLLHRTIRKLPRDSTHLHPALPRYHEPLIVTPAELNGWALRRVRQDAQLENFFEQRAQGAGLRIAVSSLSGEAEIRGCSTRREHPRPHDAFHIESIEPAEKHKAVVQKILEDAYSKQVAILVLPELRMPPQLIDGSRMFLRAQRVTATHGLLLVAAGSWHVSENGRLYNRCTVLNHIGDTLWTHDKLREYEVTPGNVAGAPELFAQCGVGPDGGVEAIARGRSLEFYDSLAARFAAAICVGFFSPELMPLLRASGANAFLVPAMTPSMADIEKCSDALVRTQHAFTLAANCGRVGASAPSFCRWPAATQSDGNLRRLNPGESLLVVDLNDL